MTTGIVLLVLLGALLHATWNTIVKSGRERFFDTVLVSSAAAILSAFALVLFLPAPLPASWPYIAASAVIHIAYFWLVAAAFRADMSFTYPLMRGTAPLLVAAASGPFLAEPLGVLGWAGVLAISGGILGLTISHRHGATARSATLLALANAVVIAGYTILDGLGARASGSAPSYVSWTFLLNAPALLAIVLLSRRWAFLAYASERWALAFVGGAATFGSYSLALFAMTKAPIALVAALRECSILFALALAALVLRERLGSARIAAGVVITAGVVALRLA